MKTLILYATKYGAAETCAKKLKEKLSGEVELLNLKGAKNIDLATYDKVIIGSSVYIGKIRKEARNFCENNLNELQKKKIALYISCMSRGEDAEKQIANNFPSVLVENALTVDILGGAFSFKKMNFFERMVIKKIAGTDEDESNILEESINKFANIINVA
ncbi:MAG: flavodoxin domain-containing protein [Bacillota bacterium]